MSISKQEPDCISDIEQSWYVSTSTTILKQSSTVTPTTVS